MNRVLHQADSRGRADHGWLLSQHTFSFANYHNPQRVHFGALRVINDDIVQPAMGFGTHPHENMEIISIPLAGALRHRDSMGNTHIVSAGEVQVMSAGSGVTHSEYNASDREEVNFLQIWIFPKEKNIVPRYGQKRFDRSERQNRFQTLVSPDSSSETIWINQDAWLSMVDLEAGATVDYRIRRPGNGVYFFTVAGSLQIDRNHLERRDGLAVKNSSDLSITAHSSSELLCIEVPMHLTEG